MSWHKGFRTEPPKYRPVAVVDIGSNSVRLVVYDGLRRSPSPIFNEKILCGLGRGVATKGKLAEEGMVRAFAALKRFRALARQIGAKHVFAVATAAAREASNGAQFIAKAEKALGCNIKVLTGKEEARYAALGVIAGIPDADGVVGDLGGGSLELIDIKDGKLREGVTLPLGPLAPHGPVGRLDRQGPRDHRRGLRQGGDPEAAQGPHLLCGGRHLAEPGQAPHGAEPLSAARAALLPAHQAAGHVALGPRRPSSPTSLKEIREVSKSRSDTMPFGALVLERLLHHSQPDAVEISVYGVREGLLYSKLPGRKRSSDALLSSCWDFARRYARSPEHELELCDWTDQVFGPGKLAETEEQRRLRYAACLLADIGWRAHPDYRAERSLSMISQAAFVGIDHPGPRLPGAHRLLPLRRRGRGRRRAEPPARRRGPPARPSPEQHVPAGLHPLRRHAGHAAEHPLKLGDNKTLVLSSPEARRPGRRTRRKAPGRAGRRNGPHRQGGGRPLAVSLGNCGA